MPQNSTATIPEGGRKRRGRVGGGGGSEGG